MENRNDQRRTYYILVGLVMIALGLFSAIRPELLLSILPVVFGLGLILSSLVKIQNSVNLRKIKYEYWWIALIMGLLSVIFGIVVIVNPFTDVLLTVRMIGIFFVVDGLTGLASTWLYMAECRHYQNKNTKNIEVNEHE